MVDPRVAVDCVPSCSPHTVPAPVPSPSPRKTLARRLVDPLSELLKIEPSALGVGMYQKDLPPKELGARLDAATEDAVATVGVPYQAQGAAEQRRNFQVGGPRDIAAAGLRQGKALGCENTVDTRAGIQR